MAGDKKVGQITTAIWSPRFENNIAIAMLDKAYWETGTQVSVESGDGLRRSAKVVDYPCPIKSVSS